MSRAGATATVVLTFAGRAAADSDQEVDLIVDDAGDPLAIDLAGDPLVVTPAVLWTGRTASEIT